MSAEQAGGTDVLSREDVVRQTMGKTGPGDEPTGREMEAAIWHPSADCPCASCRGNRADEAAEDIARAEQWTEPANMHVAVARLRQAERRVANLTMERDNARRHNAELIELTTRQRRGNDTLRRQLALAVTGRIKGAHVVRSFAGSEESAAAVIAAARLMLDLGHVPEVRFGWYPEGEGILSIDLLAVGEDARE